MLVLASSSPRRREILTNAGIEFTVQPAHTDESRRLGEPAIDYARRVALDKARAVARKNPRAIVLGADTIVVVDEEVLGKPNDPADARRMLKLLSGRSHQVVTAVALIDRHTTRQHEEITQVEFSTLSDAEIADYVADGEPMDKAGAYAIQGRASRWIQRIEGDYFNVMGLPVAAVWRMLQEIEGRA